MEGVESSVVAELRARHGHSAQPESLQVMAVLQSVVEVLQAEGMNPADPTTLFAAVMSSLERPDTRSSPQVLAAMLTVLSATLGRVPTPVLRAKFGAAVGLLSAAVADAREAAAAVKAAIGCLGTVLAAADAAGWAEAAPAWALLLGFLMDGRPKVRRRAAAAALEVLASAQRAPQLLAQESEALAQLCRQVLPGPAAAARAAAAASNKQRSAAEDAIARAVADTLHLLGALKQLLPLVAGPALPGVLDGVLKLYSLRQPLITRHATDALAALAAAPGGHLSPGQLDQLLGLVLEGEGLWEAAEKAGGGADGPLSLVRLLEVSLRSLAQRDAPAAARRLPRAAHTLVAQLGARQDGVRHGAAAALGGLLADDAVLTDGAVADGAAAAARKRGGGPPSPLAGVVAALVSALGPAGAESWGLALPAASALLRRLGETLQAALAGQLPGGAGGGDDSDGEDGAAPASGAAAGQAVAQGIALAAAPLVRQLGELYGGAFDAEEDAAGGDPLAALTAGADDDDSDAPGGGAGGGRRGGGRSVAGTAAAGGQGGEGHGPAAEAALGVALRWLGPESVLAALPLQLKEGIDGTAEPRTWLLPMLRRHVRGARLGYWTGALLPLARALGSRSAAAAAAGDQLLALHCHTMEAQIWAALPAFCSWPADAAAAYPPAAKDWAAAFHAREDLRGTVAAALERLCRQARAAAIAAGDASLLPPGEGGGAAGRKAAAGRRGHGGGGDGAGSDDADAGGSDAGADAGLSDDGSDGEDCGAPRGRARRASDPSAAGVEVGAAPSWFGGPRAAAQLAALRPLAKNWLPLLLTTFLDSPPEARAGIGAAVTAYAAIAEPTLVAGLFRAALSKLVKIQRDAAAEVPAPDEVTEGGSTPSERAASFLEAALALALEGPLDDAALAPLAAAAKPLVLGDSDTLLQKRGYRVLAALAEHRPGWARRQLGPLLELALRGAGASVSAAKRHRLRLLRPLILLLDPSSGAPVPALAGVAGAPGLAGADAIAAAADDDARRAAVGSALVGELVLCTKEANTKTREAAYALLVGLAHELDDARPLHLAGGGGGGGMDSGGEGEGAEGRELAGGLIDFFNAVLAGLVGTTPHMVSATVMAAARLLFEFSGALESVAPRLLAAVLLLLRSPSREVVKSVLGFVKVAAMRLPAETLTAQLPSILEGLLLWSDDSKNRFRLKTRAIVERLVRRCGQDAVAAACPDGDSRLISHIRKQNARKERRRGGSEAGSEGGDLETRSLGGRSSAARSAAARTARASEWGHTAIFGDDGDDGEGDGPAGRGGARSLSGRGRAQVARGGAAGRLLEAAANGGGAEPLDLLDAGTARTLVRAAAGGGAPARARPAAAAFETRGDGRMVIDDPEAAEEAAAKRRAKRKRAGAGEEFFIDSEDSDYDDLRGYGPGIERALVGAKSVRFAPSAAGGASAGGRSAGGRSAGGRSAGGRSARGGGRGGGRASQHSGDRFKPKRGETGGDAKAGGGVEPYAYWSFDRKLLLDKRRGKQAGASKKLGSVVKAAQEGAAKGAKAKRLAAKRQKR
ncbi:hypothetical protein Rsub_12563 [Raphidocelis subcapitata]|uniref:Uncharacterized protein n=1 Tax=Raphidocelis subcapitata TaxID=307507 RepID=A0A2V0PP68_9CHLO|nr:hypothetical protein Rsub_12563 [Raphidocelis subcapitata]|eukprot:GBF99810.1 hypothetical protein Rsub_12563 [Raphidocelis subcapitata]